MRNEYEIVIFSNVAILTLDFIAPCNVISLNQLFLVSILFALFLVSVLFASFLYCPFFSYHPFLALKGEINTFYLTFCYRI